METSSSEDLSTHVPSIIDDDHALELLRRLQRDKKYCKVQLEAGGELFFVHKCLFASFARYFDEKFENLQGNNDVVVVDEVKGDSMRQIVEFVYSGQIFMTDENAIELLDAAELLKLPKIIKHCVTFLGKSLSVENCFDVYSCGIKYNVGELIRRSTLLIGNNLKSVCGNKQFLSLDLVDFEKVVATRKKNSSNEEGAYVATVVWVKHDSDVRQEYFTRLFGHIDVKFFTESFIKDVVLHEQLIRSSVECLNTVADELASRCDRPSDADRECMELNSKSRLQAGGKTPTNGNRALSPHHRHPPPPPKPIQGEFPENPKFHTARPLNPTQELVKPIPMRPRAPSLTNNNDDGRVFPQVSHDTKQGRLQGAKRGLLNRFYI